MHHVFEKKGKNAVMQILLTLFILISARGMFPIEAAVPPNSQDGECGPYYFWYQTGPTGYQQHLDVCGITFDISDAIDDFDLVYFEDSEIGRRIDLDENRDGISDENFFRRQGNIVEWRPSKECVRITQQGCESTEFDKRCAYAMIRLQPRRDFTQGSAVIPISVELDCGSSPSSNCQRSFVIRHTYSDCDVSLGPEFVLVKNLKPHQKKYHYGEKFVYTATVLNTSGKAGKTNLTLRISDGSNHGVLRLAQYAIACPQQARCVIPDMNDQYLQITLDDFPADLHAEMSFVFEADTEGIPRVAGEKWTSDFTITTELSTGGHYTTEITIGHLIKQ